MAKAISGGYHVWTKGQRHALSKYFWSYEFDCPCQLEACSLQRIAVELVEKLDRVREAYGRPIKVTSGFRCEGKQKVLRDTLPPGHTAVGKSTHELGEAADVRGPNPTTLLPLLEAEFKAIGTAKTFYHIDLRVGKIRRWIYS